MASTARVFFAGVATSVLLIGAGFGGGVALVKTAMDVPQKVVQTKAASPDKPPPPARVVLPAMTEAASMPPAPAPVPDPQPQATPQPEPQVIPAQEVHAEKQDIENEKHALRQAEAEKQRAERAEQRKKAEDRERRHRRYAERKARREAARQQLQEAQDQQQHEHREVRRTAGQVGILAFDSDDEPPRQSFFGD